MKRPALIFCLTLAALLGGGLVRAQDPTLPAPTLVPPTLVPTQATDVLPPADFSGVATAQNEGVLRVGALYNVPPFSYLDDNGKLTGYEIAILEAISVDISTPLEFVQVTGENALSELNLGRVDILVGEQTITRDAEGLYDFTHPHYLNQQRMVVLQNAPYQAFADLAGQTVSIVNESKGEEAAGDLLAQGLNYTLRPYYTEKDALDALVTGEAAAMVGELDNFKTRGLGFVQNVKVRNVGFSVIL